MLYQGLRNLLLAGVVMGTAACGGGGVNSTPLPPVTPAPTPGDAPIPPQHIGLVSSAPFAVLAMGASYEADASGAPTTLLSGPSSQNVQFSYDPASNSYQITVPGFQAGTLTNTGYGGSAGRIATSSTSQVAVGSSASLQPLFVVLPVPGSSYSSYTYTSFGSWNGKTGAASTSVGTFAYGVPTALGDVPTTGSATYNATVEGSTVDPNYFIRGTAALQFDFAAGTLAGHLDPTISSIFGLGEQYSLGRYDFSNTVFGVGSTSFSGKLSQSGLSGTGSFNGLFTGPSAAELMAQFTAPYVFNGQQGSMSGVWVGKKN